MINRVNSSEADCDRCSQALPGCAGVFRTSKVKAKASDLHGQYDSEGAVGGTRALDEGCLLYSLQRLGTSKPTAAMVFRG